MALASFPLIVKRWSKSKLHYGTYAQYIHLREYLTEELFLTRLDAIEQHVLNEYPQVWLDTYLFLFAIVLVAVAAAISIVARATNLSVWYPLLILLAPAIIAFFTTRRRNSYYVRLSRYYDSLQTLLKELNSQDVTRQIKWSFRRPRESDTAFNLMLKPPLVLYNINFIVEASQIDIENELAQEGETLPAYDTSMMDIVLDMGPNHPQEPRLMTQGHPLPPAYDPSSTIEMRPIRQPPPSYPTATN
ncbi:hypothetical protein G6F46_011744 [Rhizopus delemar]|uniref:Uncharacterized protein n=3 Tax=Rhizopus TaxID=4842 RepID=I1BY47_RHIO9|nr:hypothetical protein RO3G_05832 [Rhizopus delemar RA 99-880]KAG1046965.1 hypothetical protein G6F43_010570 [Rhizopus delemar]KAG1547730.1 hypothetical protein G6F51_004090 [Rhizopus arrhizus]KAG1445139.1 hypothetical protein G6F55_012070 [Rhizopus delemar]KAG1489345.1 hypothetical protein G6F54_011506 [Rhizopus delemar]|eukprot:EIE81127.1 hypothetical protein RO3G_05832 [Rhizopus delemar RA 99-880]